MIIVWLACPLAARSEPANSLRELSSELNACVKAPSGPARSELTIVFALTRNGALLGKPTISHSQLVGSPEAQRTFVEDAVRALAKCFPVRVTAGLGNAIAGRPLSIRLVIRAKETAI